VKTYVVGNNVRNGRSRSPTVADFGAKVLRKFQLVINSNYRPWSYFVPFQWQRLLSAETTTPPLFHAQFAKGMLPLD